MWILLDPDLSVRIPFAMISARFRAALFAFCTWFGKPPFNGTPNGGRWLYEQVAPNLAPQLPSKQQLDVVLLHRTQLTTAWDVIDLVNRVKPGAIVVVLAPGRSA